MANRLLISTSSTLLLSGLLALAQLPVVPLQTTPVASGFNPNNTPGMILNLDVLRPLSIQTNVSGVVTNWIDNSGLSNNATNTAALGPIFHATGGPNGGARITFTSASTQSLLWYNTNTDQVTALAVFRVTAFPGNVGTILGFHSVTLIGANELDCTHGFGGRLTCTACQNNNYALNTYYYASLQFKDSASSGNIWRTNQVQMESITCGTTVGASVAPFGVGERGSGVFYLDGDICRVWVWNRILTSGELTAAEQACKSDFGFP